MYTMYPGIYVRDQLTAKLDSNGHGKTRLVDDFRLTSPSTSIPAVRTILMLFS
jgi:hypothetical protein